MSILMKIICFYYDFAWFWLDFGGFWRILADFGRILSDFWAKKSNFSEEKYFFEKNYVVFWIPVKNGVKKISIGILFLENQPFLAQKILMHFQRGWIFHRILLENQWKSIKIVRKSMKINEKHLKSIQTWVFSGSQCSKCGFWWALVVFLLISSDFLWL